jgi:hypothetical protein
MVILRPTHRDNKHKLKHFKDQRAIYKKKEERKDTDRVVGCGTDNVDWLRRMRWGESIECSKKKLRGTCPYNNVTSICDCIPDQSV